MSRTIVWAEPERAAFVGRVAEAAGLDVVGAGEPGRSGGTSAQRLGVEAAEDLRAVLSDRACDVVLVGDAGSFGTTESSGDAEAVLAAMGPGGEGGVRVVCLEAVPASVFELTSGGWAKSRHGRRALDGVRFVPSADDHAVLAGMDDVLASFGAVRVASVRALGTAEHAGLGATLLGAVGLMLRVVGSVEVIDAALVTPEAGHRAGSNEDRLRGLHGHATAIARAESGVVGRVLASDASAAWERTLELIGPAGRLSVREDGYEWTGLDGAVVDSGQRVIERDPAVASLGGAVRRHLEKPEPRSEAFVEALTVTQAALLSTRTGQPESPAAITRATLI